MHYELFLPELESIMQHDKQFYIVLNLLYMSWMLIHSLSS